MTTDSSGEVEALKRLATYFLGQRFLPLRSSRGKGKPRPTVDILVARLPDTLLGDVPIFEDARLLGSLVIGERLRVVMGGVLQGTGADEAVRATFLL